MAKQLTKLIFRIPSPFANYLAIQKWNTKYSGVSDGLELNEFRMRVECLARIDNVSEQFVLNGAFYLFEGEALFWYLRNQRDIVSWKQLIKLLASRFVHTDNAFMRQSNCTMVESTNMNVHTGNSCIHALVVRCTVTP